MAVFVLDKKGKPLMPCSERRARVLLSRRRARIHKLYPFTIRLIDRLQQDSVLQPISCKIDPGSQVTGMALVRADENTDSVVTLIEIKHRGHQIRDALTARRAMRRARRQRQTRYRQARFLNRGNKTKGWLAPSLMHRVQTTTHWAKRLQALCPITSIHQELVKFDMQKMQDAEITGKEYQQGTLWGMEVKEYLLAKFKHQCMYCDAKECPLEVEHIVPRCAGGSHRISNLGLACRPCNQKKGAMDLKTFVKDTKRYQRIVAQVKAPLKDAAAVNSTRHALFKVLIRFGLPVYASTGAQTKLNRKQQGIEKTHALDAVCIGEIRAVQHVHQPTLHIKCMGRGTYQRTRLNQYGFPRGYLMRSKFIHGFMTGDMIKAQVLTGKKTGTYQGRVAIRQSGYFNIQTKEGLVQGIHHRHCKVIQRADGYDYQLVA